MLMLDSSENCVPSEYMPDLFQLPPKSMKVCKYWASF